MSVNCAICTHRTRHAHQKTLLQHRPLILGKKTSQPVPLSPFVSPPLPTQTLIVLYVMWLCRAHRVGTHHIRMWAPSGFSSSLWRCSNADCYHEPLPVYASLMGASTKSMECAWLAGLSSALGCEPWLLNIEGLWLLRLLLTLCLFSSAEHIIKVYIKLKGSVLVECACCQWCCW